MKIIAFPFAGGSKYSFQKFSKNIPQFTVMEYPGRGMRINEKQMNNVDSLIEDILEKVNKEISSCETYIIYGHSMGALFGYLICQKIQELGMKRPLKLIVSGRKSPSIKREKKVSQLPDELFWDEVVKLGGVPDELVNNPELKEFYIPILKTDFEVIENYQYVQKDKLHIPIDVFYGKEENIAEDELFGWKDESVQEVTITPLKGNHFFIFDNEDFFYNYFNNLTKNLIYIQNNA